MKMSNEVNEIFSAFSLFQAEVEDVKRDTQSYKGKYATLDQVVQVRKLLSKFGLGVTQVIGDCSNGSVELESIIMHKSGQYFSQVMKMEVGDLPKGISVAQHIGSNVSYARRYGLLAILGMAQEDDDAQNHNVKQSTEYKWKFPKVLNIQPMLIEEINNLVKKYEIPNDKILAWKEKFNVKDLNELRENDAKAIINKVRSIYCN